MKKILLTLALALMVGTSYSQNVKREGKVFVEQSTKQEAKKTEFSYKAKDGKTYPIYLSKNGKAYIIRVSKKSGKEYKQYLPAVTEELNKNKK